jgi:hypothetical protein
VRPGATITLYTYNESVGEVRRRRRRRRRRRNKERKKEGKL